MVFSFAKITGNHHGGYGGVLSFELKGGRLAADALQKALQIGFVAPSLGGVETLVRERDSFLFSLLCLSLGRQSICRAHLLKCSSTQF